MRTAAKATAVRFGRGFRNTITEFDTAGSAYDALQLAAKAIHSVGCNHQKINDWLQNLDSYSGAHGTYNFKKGDATLQFEVRQVQDSRIK